MSEERPSPLPGDADAGFAAGTAGPPRAAATRGRRRLGGRGARPGPAVRQPQPGPAFSPEQRLLVLDTWRRSGLPAGDFAPLVGLSRHTLYAWKKKFDEHGPAGLADKPKG